MRVSEWWGEEINRSPWQMKCGNCNWRDSFAERKGVPRISGGLKFLQIVCKLWDVTVHCDIWISHGCLSLVRSRLLGLLCCPCCVVIDREHSQRVSWSQLWRCRLFTRVVDVCWLQAIIRGAVAPSHSRSLICSRWGSWPVPFPGPLSGSVFICVAYKLSENWYIN